MIARIQRRLANLPFPDPVLQRQAMLIQSMLLAVAILSFAGAFITLLAPIQFSDAVIVILSVWSGAPIALLGVWLLHHAHFNAALLLTCLGLVFLLSFLLITTGVAGGGAVLFGYAIPIVLAGLLAGRWMLRTMIGLSGAGIVLAIVMERMQMPLSGVAAPRGENIGGILGGFIVIAIILGIFVARFGQALRIALADALQRERLLTALQAELETRVATRTIELQAALREVETRAATQQHLLEENARQRDMIQQLSIPVLPVDASTLVAPIVGMLDDSRMRMLQEEALHTLEHSRFRRVVLDISGIPLVDDQVAQGLLDLVRQTRLLGAEAALVGIRPEVAQAMISLGVDLRSIRTFRDLEASLHDEW